MREEREKGVKEEREKKERTREVRRLLPAFFALRALFSNGGSDPSCSTQI